MRKLSLSILAASIAFIPAAAAAADEQGRRGGPPAGHSWRGGGTMHGGGNVQFRHRGGMHPGGNFRGHRFQRGFVIPSFWFGPQFHVQNWQVYGFSNPGDGRWVRFYDDAYLIGHDGRVRDHRYGMDWDRYGEAWEDEDGIPAYRGRRDYRPDDEDYEHAERHGGGSSGPGNRHHDGHAAHGGGHVMYGAPGGHGGYGYGAAYGGYYGYGAYAYPIVIETVTTSGGGCGCSYEVVEEVVEVRQRARRRPPVRRPPPPRRPPPGERG
jgi:Ni/Co efflux regulator RcnB